MSRALVKYLLGPTFSRSRFAELIDAHKHSAPRDQLILPIATCDCTRNYEAAQMLVDAGYGMKLPHGYSRSILEMVASLGFDLNGVMPTGETLGQWESERDILLVAILVEAGANIYFATPGYKSMEQIVRNRTIDLVRSNPTRKQDELAVMRMFHDLRTVAKRAVGFTRVCEDVGRMVGEMLVA